MTLYFSSTVFFPVTISHFSWLSSSSLIFDRSVTTCLPLPETPGQGSSEMQLVKIHPALLSSPESTCGELMPAVSSHYLIGIEMHLACVFVCTALLVESPPPSSSTTSPTTTTTILHTRSLIQTALLGGGFLSSHDVRSNTGLTKQNESWHQADLQEGGSCGSLQLIRALFNSWDLSCYSSFIFTAAS